MDPILIHQIATSRDRPPADWTGPVAADDGWPGVAALKVGPIRIRNPLKARTPQVPEPSAAESALGAEESGLLREGATLLRGLDPVILEAIGLERDPETGAFRVRPGSRASFDQGQEILQALNERALRLARGEAEADPFLEREIAKERGILDERLLRQLGPGGGETSSPGLELLSRFGTDVAATRAANTRRALAEFEGLSLERGSAQDAALTNRLARYGLLPGSRFTAAGAFGDPLSRMQAGRLGTFQAQQAARTPSFGELFTTNFATSLGKSTGELPADLFKNRFSPAGVAGG